MNIINTKVDKHHITDYKEPRIMVNNISPRYLAHCGVALAGSIIIGDSQKSWICSNLHKTTGHWDRLSCRRERA